MLFNISGSIPVSSSIDRVPEGKKGNANSHLMAAFHVWLQNSSSKLLYGKFCVSNSNVKLGELMILFSAACVKSKYLEIKDSQA